MKMLQQGAKIKLFVDDIRQCPEGWQLARTITDAIRALSNFEIEIVSLDHDISCRMVNSHEHTSNETFEPVARYIALMPEDTRPVVWFHTGNPDGGRTMARILQVPYHHVDQGE